jgi:hypothetical protein
MTLSVTQRVSHETCPSPKVIAVILMFTKPPFAGLMQGMDFDEFCPAGCRFFSISIDLEEGAVIWAKLAYILNA